MRKIIFVIALILFLFLVTTRIVEGRNKAVVLKEQNKVEEAAKVAQARIALMTVPEMIDYIAKQLFPNGAETTPLVKKVTFCEAGHRLGYILHDGGLGIGTTGYHRATFEGDKITFNRPDLKYESNFDQLTLMSIAFEAGEQYRTRWTTYIAYMNGGTYIFTDSNGKTHVVVCK